MKKILIGIYFLFTIGTILVICTSNYSSKDTKAISAGEKIYQQQQCTTCHGNTGKGEGIKPGTAINNQHFLSTVSDKDISNAIKYGREGTLMPKYGSSISKKDLKNLVTYIRNWQTEDLKLTAPKVISGNVEKG